MIPMNGPATWRRLYFRARQALRELGFVDDEMDRRVNLLHDGERVVPLLPGPPVDASIVLSMDLREVHVCSPLPGAIHVDVRFVVPDRQKRTQPLWVRRELTTPASDEERVALLERGEVPDRVWDVVEEACALMMRHEVQEQLRVGGRRRRDPHEEQT